LHVQAGQVANVKIDIMVGINVTLDVLFKKERVIAGTPANMSARVRIFNDQGQLVGEWMSSEGTYVTGNGFARAADGTNQYPFGPLRAAIPQPLPLNSYNFIPGGTTLLHAVIAGLPQVPAATRNAPAALPGFYNQGDPVFLPYACVFIQACYSGRLGLNFRTGQIGVIPPETTIPGNPVGYPFPYTGIAGSPDYQGGWTAEVDFVPWYANNTNTMELVSGDHHGQTPTQDNTFAQYYAPVNGLLMGESYHIIPGTTAASGLSLTEDAALSTTFLYHSMAMNHLGPYSQEGVWQVSGTHNSGEASGIFEVDLNGLVTGNALAFTWSNEFRPLSWGLVNVVGAQGGSGWNFYTYDGVYEAFMPPGTYQFTISSPGYATQSWSVAVSAGQTGTGQNVYLEQSNIPVPEFSGLAIAAVSALAASLYVLRRRRK